MKHIIFDYDYTLFDTGYLLRKSPRPLTPGEGFTVQLAAEINWEQVDKSKLHYPETDSTLHRLNDLNIQVYLFTEGDIAGQEYKFNLTGIKRFIPDQHVHVFSDHKIDHFQEVLAPIPNTDSIYYMEDKPSYLKAAKLKYPNIKTILIKQGPWWDFPVADFSPSITINSLSEILKHL